MENTSQFMELSESEMLDLWKTMMQLQPAHYGCTIERTDGIDIDELLLIHIRKWYASLLLSAPDGIVPVEDVKDLLSVMVADNGVVTAMVPPECVRPVEWKLKAWQKSVTLFLQPNVPEAAYLHNEWTRPGVCDPAAVDYGNRILLFTLPNGELPIFDMARCVVRPTNGKYIFHASVLESLRVNGSTGQRGDDSIFRNLDNSSFRVFEDSI
ncbi:MAG: hypothetical protein MR708_09840 [Bacteroidales bacterium]|nr:hypothetical protein [Bacteroidales bacterium]